MKLIIEACGGNYLHWQVLHQLARKQTRAGVNAWMYGGLGRTKTRSGTTILFYIFLAAMSINTYSSLTTGLFDRIELYPVTSTFITFQITTLFVIFTVSQVFGDLFISSDDYNNLCFRPVDNRTYFLSKLTAISIQLYLVTAIMTIPPTIALLVELQIIECIGYIASNFLLQTCVAVLALTGFMHIANKAVSKGKDPRLGLIGGLIAFSMMIPTFWYYLLPKIRHMEFPTDVPLWADLINPFSWYASVPAILQGSVSPSTVVGTVMTVVATVLVYVYLVRYSGLDLLVKVQVDHDDVSKSMEFARPTRGLERALSLIPSAALRDHPMWILFFAHLRGNKKFRKSLLGLIFVAGFIVGYPLVVSLIFRDSDFSQTAVATSIGLLYTVVTVICLLMTKAFLLSSEFRASWVLFTAPIDLMGLWSFSDRLVRHFMAIPYVALLFIVSCIFQFTESWIESLKQIFVFGLVLDIVLKAKSGIEVSVPFSQGPEVMGKFIGQFVTVAFAMVFGNVCVALIPFCTVRIDFFLVL